MACGRLCSPTILRSRPVETFPLSPHIRACLACFVLLGNHILCCEERVLNAHITVATSVFSEQRYDCYSPQVEITRHNV